MPELAEVALYANDLSQRLRNQKIIKVSFPNQKDWGSKIIPSQIQNEIKQLIGEQISFISQGKALLLKQHQKERPIIEFRLGMTGQFRDRPLESGWRRHCFLKIKFEDITIYYVDPRRFSRILKPSSSIFALGGYKKMGFWTVRKPRIPNGYLKTSRISWLLSRGHLTGVGNYMANEALGRLQLSPFEYCRDKYEAQNILRKCVEVAEESYKVGGNSFGSGFYSLSGKVGGYSKYCRFYQNSKIPRIIFHGRPVFTHFKKI
jgi:formamidopyrimidine-DNA glycosylase